MFRVPKSSSEQTDHGRKEERERHGALGIQNAGRRRKSLQVGWSDPREVGPRRVQEQCDQAH